MQKSHIAYTRKTRKTHKTQSNLSGGTFVGSGSFGCAFQEPLDVESLSLSSSLSPKKLDVESLSPKKSKTAKMLGKVMTRVDAKKELDAMRPFQRADPSSTFGVYAMHENLLRVNLRRATESAGGTAELEKCKLTRTTSRAGRLVKALRTLQNDTNADNAVAEAEARLRAKIDDAAARIARARTKQEERDARAAWERYEQELDETMLYELVVPFAELGDMQEIGQSLKSSLPSLDVARVHLVAFFNLTQGLECYHRNSLVHRDIKPSNVVLMGPQPVYKFIDFGESLSLTDAADDDWQSSPYVFFPVLVRVKTGAPFSEALFSEQALLAKGLHWIPRWLTTVQGLKQTFAYASRLKTTEEAVLHTDVFQLALTLCFLYWALTGATFALELNADSSEVRGVHSGHGVQSLRSRVPFDFTKAHSEALATLDDAIGVLVLNATRGKLDAREFSQGYLAALRLSASSVLSASSASESKTTLTSSASLRANLRAGSSVGSNVGSNAKSNAGSSTSRIKARQVNSKSLKSPKSPQIKTKKSKRLNRRN